LTSAYRAGPQASTNAGALREELSNLQRADSAEEVS